MDIVEFKEPRTHVIINDFLTKDDQDILWNEIKENESNFISGKYKKGKKEEVHENIKKNLVFEVSKVYPSMTDSLIRSMFYYKIFKNPEMMETLDNAKSPIYSLLRFTSSDRTKVSAYRNGDFYDWHKDLTEQGLLTVIYMLCKEPQKFTGGNIMMKWDNVEKSIPFKNNSVLIFPRNTPHKVSEIKLESDDFYDRRFTIQCFANFVI